LKSDYRRLSELHRECFPDKPWPADEFAGLQKSGCEIIMSENAFVVWRAAAGEAEIITIGVRPSMRGTGIASALLAAIENESRKGNIKKIFLEVASDNAAAIKLYEAAGFAKIGVRPKYYGVVDAIAMAKELP
jgi:ribosomal-protein-alanine N-acetyltransferase